MAETIEPTGEMDISDIPYEESKRICNILDQQNKWQQLALKMNFDQYTIETRLNSNVLREKSPSEELLSMWSYYDHTVLELFIVLERIGAYDCMIFLKKYVPRKHHKRIKQENIVQVMQRLHIRYLFNKTTYIHDLSVKNLQKIARISSFSDSKIARENFEANTSKYTNINKILQVPHDTKDNNVTTPNTKNNQNNLNNIRHVQNSNKKINSTKLINACVMENAGTTPQIPYEELEQATNNWNSTLLLGKGGFGTVFKGTKRKLRLSLSSALFYEVEQEPRDIFQLILGIWKFTEVAIKRLELKNASTTNEHIRQSITELQCLNTYRHDNILPLYGYSVGGPHPCLVYQYMKGGALDFRLRGSNQNMPQNWLSWDSRMNIAIGISRGLQYLHTVLVNNKPLVHGDIKSANILLDNVDNPRIGDFGLARKGPEITQENMEISRIQGTRPYLPEEFIKGKQFSVKIDVYSFGIVLFELATALAPYNPHREGVKKYLKDFVDTYEGNIFELKDKRVSGSNFFYEELIRIGRSCVAGLASQRPEMVQVLVKLETAKRSGHMGNVQLLIDV